MEMKINVEDYLSREDITEMIRYRMEEAKIGRASCRERV